MQELKPSISRVKRSDATLFVNSTSRIGVCLKDGKARHSSTSKGRHSPTLLSCCLISCPLANSRYIFSLLVVLFHSFKRHLHCYHARLQPLISSPQSLLSLSLPRHNVCHRSRPLLAIPTTTKSYAQSKQSCSPKTKVTI